jgi:hypothetical protein
LQNREASIWRVLGQYLLTVQSIIQSLRKTQWQLLCRLIFFVAVLNTNKPEFCYFSEDAYADLLHQLVDIGLAQIVKPRIGQEEVEVSIDYL